MFKERRGIAIVRVSQTKGRRGERFLSPSEQRDVISEICAKHQIRCLSVAEELDVSGGAVLKDRPGLSAAVERVEAGEADTIVTAYMNRLVREVEVQLEVFRRVEDAGGDIVTDQGYLTNKGSTGRMHGIIQGAIDENVRLQAKERSAEAQRRAVAAGIAPFPTDSFPGYARGDDGRLTVDPETAPHVAEAFTMRAAGRTITEIRSYLQAHGIERTSYSTTTLLRSRLPLGEIRFGKLRNDHAHEPIIDKDTWRAAQARKLRGTRPPSQRLLARQGILRCGGCGSRMVVATNRQGKKDYYVYRCPTPMDCERRSHIGAEIAERVVVAYVREALAGIEGRASAEAHVREAEQDLGRAGEALDSAIRTLADFTDEPAARERLSELRQQRDEAQQRIEHLGGASVAVTLNADTDWDRLTLDEQRGLIRATIESATVAPGRGAERIAITAAA